MHLYYARLLNFPIIHFQFTMQPQEHDAKNLEKMDEAINSIKQKMKLVNYNNFQPPYLLHTLTKFRETYLSRFVKDIKLEGQNSQQTREKLKTVHYIIEKFDDQCFDVYSGQLIEPYMRKMFQDNYEFDNIQFKEINTHYNLQSEIQETLNQAAEWLAQIQITQDLLARVSLYFKLKTPSIIQRVREDGLRSENSWTGSFLSGVNKLISFGLRKGSKMIQSTFFTAVAPGALMLTLAIVGGKASVPFKSSLTTKNMITAALIATVPFILDSMAETVEKSDYKAKLRRWAVTFEKIAESIRKFNDMLEQSIRNCTLSANSNQFLLQKTNLQKIIADLNKGLDSVTSYNEEKFSQMRDRTEAYFKEYLEIQEDEWTLVIPKEQDPNNFIVKGTKIQMKGKQQRSKKQEEEQQFTKL